MSSRSKKEPKAKRTSAKVKVHKLIDDPQTGEDERWLIGQLFGEIGINKPVKGCTIC